MFALRLIYCYSLFNSGMTQTDCFEIRIMQIFHSKQVSHSAHQTTHYESRIFAANFLSIYFLGLLLLEYIFSPGKSFKLISQYTQKYQYNSSHKKDKTLCNSLNWGNWNSGFVTLVAQWDERDIQIELFCLYTS